MLPLPEVCDLGGVVVVDRVHSMVLKPLGCGRPSALHLHRLHPGVPAELQDHQAGHRLPSGERRISWSIQLQPEGLNGVQRHS